jgi:UDP-N-acetylmuramate--alanine ligase
LLFDDFSKCFVDADQAILSDIYCVRDSDADRASVSSEQLVEQICASGQNAIHLPKFEQITQYLKANATTGDLIVTMGAGGVWEIGRNLVS